MFGNLYTGRRVLITGHTGFKGSWLALWLHTMGAEVVGLALDPESTPNHWSLLGLNGVTDHRADLRDAQAVRTLLDAKRPEIVFHLAAQPLVRRSYREPAATFDTNVMGLVHLLEAVRTCPSVRVVINATTDKVYAEHARPSGYREDDPLGGHDPYSSSKACAELVSDCYRKSYFFNTAIRIATARAGNVIGGGDWAEDRLVPDLMRAAASGRVLAVRNPGAIRPWQHVLEPLSGYLRLAQQLWENQEIAGAWNFGPRADGEITVQALAERLGAFWGALRITIDTTPQLREATTLRLDTGKATQLLGWRPVWDIDVTLTKTAHWYLRFHKAGRADSAGDLAAYIDDARRLGLEWAA